MLTQRLIVAAIGLPLVAVLLLLPEPVFAAALQVILAAAAFELVRALDRTRPLTLPLSAAAATALLVATARAWPPEWPDFPLWAFVLMAAVALTLMVSGWLVASLGGWWITAVLYTGVFGAHIVLVRGLAEGQAWLVVMLAATFATDTGAYAIGRLFGRHLFVPRISPKKTWEGAIGGLVIGAGAAAVAVLALDLPMEGAALVALALALPVAAISGDLLESALKRRMDVKDMSGLLPGHGGLLDRLDSVLIVGACLYWILRWQ
ncbi:MAG: phosphatidate cytidylyltransferase [Chloroflexi bacterium]|nr:phosphatidate cytidylyltransferase [Chloroflexota bacterium]